MSTSRRLRAPFYALLFSLSFLGCAAPRAAAQNTGAIVVPTPPFIGGHYAKQNENNPETAHDAWTGQDLKWDRDKKSWVDVKTGQALGFDGQLASDGTVIPAPPFINTPGVGLHEARQQKAAEYNGHGDPEAAFDDGTKQILHWDREKQSWFDTTWDRNTRSRIETGQPLGFNGVAVNTIATAPSTPPATVPASQTAEAGPCPTPDECVVLQQAYREADARAVAAADALMQAQASRDNDLAQAFQLDKSASHRGDPDVSKAEHEQAEALRDKLPNAQANYDAAAKAAIAAWENYQNCLKGLKDCPPKKPAQAANETGTTNNPSGNTTGSTTGSTTSATPGAPAEPLGPSNASLAGDLCERAKALRNIAAHDRQMADAATDQRTRDYLQSDAKMMDGMAKEREDLARHYDPNACPENAQAIPGGNGTASQNGAGSQSAAETSSAPAWGPWILIFPGMPLWNTEENRWYGYNSDGTPRTEASGPGSGEWIFIFPGLPLWNTEERRWYGYNSDYSPRPDEQPREGSNTTSSASPAPAAPALQCTANTPTVRAEGDLDIPFDCSGTLPANPGIGLRSNVPLTGVDLQYSFGSTPFTIPGTLAYNGHRAQFDLPSDLGKASSFKMDLDVKYNITAGYDHFNLRLWDSPGIDITPRSFTAPITNNEIGSFSSFTPQWGGGYGGWGASNTTNNPGSLPLGTPLVGTSTFGWGLNRTPSLCTDTTTTTYVPPYNAPLGSSSFGSGLGYSLPPCNLNLDRGTLTLGGGNDFGFGGLRGWSAFNTPGGPGTSAWGLTPNQSGGDWNGTGIQTPQTPTTTPGFTGNGYGGFYNPSPFVYLRPQAYYDDGPQYFGIFDPWNRMPSFCDYDFPDKLRSMPQIAQALAAEARSRQPRASRVASERRDAHFQIVSMRVGSPVSSSPGRAARPAQMGGGPRQVAIEARIVEVAPAFSYSIVSNGKSTGQAFELQVADPTGKVKTVAMRDGTVLEAIKPGVTQPVAAPAGGSVVKQPLNGYCLEFHKQPPADGTLYRIADASVQQKYSSLRYLDRAAAQMSENSGFHPDSNPDAYKDAIFQYAIWSTLEGWGEQEFTEHFVERTKENAQALNVKWTKEMEDALRAAAPGRWGDISTMMNQAQSLEKQSQQRVNSRESRGER